MIKRNLAILNTQALSTHSLPLASNPLPPLHQKPTFICKYMYVICRFIANIDSGCLVHALISLNSKEGCTYKRVCAYKRVL